MYCLALLLWKVVLPATIYCPGNYLTRNVILAMAYNVMRWPKCIFLVLKLTLVLDLWVLFVFCWLPLLKLSTLTFIRNTAVRKGPWRFWLHCHDYHCTPMLRYWNSSTLTCQTSPWWQSCEWCNNFCLPSGCHCSLDLNSMVIRWSAH